MKLKQHTIYEIEHGAEVFEVAHEPDGSNAQVHVCGNKAVVGYLVLDNDCEDPRANDEGTETIDAADMDSSEIADLALTNPGRCFWISQQNYRCSEAIVLTATNTTPDPMSISDGPEDSDGTIEYEVGDGGSGRLIYIAPDDTPDPAAYCDNSMEEYRRWADGECYGVIVHRYTRRSRKGKWVRADNSEECWGFIGNEYANEELTREVRSAVKHHLCERCRAALVLSTVTGKQLMGCAG